MVHTLLERVLCKIFLCRLSLLGGLASRYADVKQAIVAAAKLNDDCFRYFHATARTAGKM
jgi:hypothetical protein